MEDFKVKHTITDRQAIVKALCLPSSIPDGFKLKPLKPIGVSKFKGDNMPSNWSVNTKFTIGSEYPLYDDENGLISVGNDGVGYKVIGTAWTKIKWI